MAYVLVETISQYRMRYVVEVPDSHPEWALDTVTVEEAREFSQHYLGETIISDRVVNKEEIVNLFRKDNDYLHNLNDEEIMERFVTKQVSEDND